MAAAPIPTPPVLWWQDGTPALLAIEAVEGTSLAKLGEPSPPPPAARSKAGAALARLHAAPVPTDIPLRGDEALSGSIDELATWLRRNTSVSPAVIDSRAAYAHAMLDDRGLHTTF